MQSDPGITAFTLAPAAVSMFGRLIMFLEFECFLLPGFCFMPGAQQRIFKLTKNMGSNKRNKFNYFYHKNTHTG